LIIALTFGGAVPKCRAMSSNDGETPTFVV
jgi:hypothetical protein